MYCPALPLCALHIFTHIFSAWQPLSSQLLQHWHLQSPVGTGCISAQAAPSTCTYCGDSRDQQVEYQWHLTATALFVSPLKSKHHVPSQGGAMTKGTPFTPSRGAEGAQLPTSCLYPSLPVLNQLPEGDRRQLHAAMSSLTGWCCTECPCPGAGSLKAEAPWVRPLLTPRARAGRERTEYFRVVNYFSSSKKPAL